MSECLLRLFARAFHHDYPRLKERLKEVNEVLSECVLEIFDTERYVFTLNQYYVGTVNRLKEKTKKEK
jgi:hypothetical protein